MSIVWTGCKTFTGKTSNMVIAGKVGDETRYLIVHIDGKFKPWPMVGEYLDEFNTPDDAKHACQTHYNQQRYADMDKFRPNRKTA